MGAEGAAEPERVTDPEAKQRFSDGTVDAARNRLVTVMEDHSGEGEAANSIASVGASSYKRRPARTLCGRSCSNPCYARPHWLHQFRMTMSREVARATHQAWDQLVPYINGISAKRAMLRRWHRWPCPSVTFD